LQPFRLQLVRLQPWRQWPGPEAVRASLADQHDEPHGALAAAVSQALVRPATLAIALGANLPSPAGGPADTLLAVRPLLEEQLHQWARAALAELVDPSASGAAELRCSWSPLLQTAPVGGPPGQRDYTNGALLVTLPAALAFQAADASAVSRLRRVGSSALALLKRLQQLEARFGRPAQGERRHWGPRSLDLDLLWWGEVVLDQPATVTTPALQLPHPLWRQRPFVLEPLAALMVL